MAQFKTGDLREEALARVIVDWETGDALGSLATPLQTQLPQWHYIGGGTFTLDGANDQELNIPADATIVELRARAGEVYFSVNGVNCSAGAPGYIPEDGAEIVGPLDNLDRLWIFSATADTVCHYMWFQEA